MGLGFILKICKEICLFKIGYRNKSEFASRIKKMVVKGGPVLIKYIQLLLLNNYLNKNKNLDYLIVLKNVEDNVYPPDKCDIVRILGQPFMVKGGKSLSCGSIAYAYEVFIENNEEESYILKKTHNNIKEAVFNSYSLLHSSLSYLPSSYNLLDASDKLLKLMMEQTDMQREKQMLIKFGQVFKDVPKVHIPKVIMIDNEQLIMSKEKGMHIDAFVHKYPHHKEEIAHLLFGCIHKMISKNVVHGDFHKGNFLLFEEKGEVHVSILDFGLVFELTDEQKEHFLDYLEMNQSKDLIKLINTFVENDVTEDIPLEKLKLKYGHKGDLYNVQDLCKEFNIKLPLEMLHFISALTLLNHVCLGIDKKSLSKNAMDYMIKNYFVD